VIVLLPPALDEDLGLQERIKNLTVEKLVTELSVERFVVAVFPWAAWLDVERFHADLFQPFPYDLCGKLRPVVRPNEVGHTPENKKLRQATKHVIGIQLAGNVDGQALPGKLVDHGKHSKRPTIAGSGLHEVVAPHMVLALRPKPDARPIMEPKPSTFRLLAGYLEALLLTDSLDSLVVDVPSVPSKKLPDPAVAIPTELASKLDDPLG